MKHKAKKLTLEERRARIAEKIEKFKAGGFDEEDDDEDDD